MGSFKVKDIPDNYFFTKPVYLDSGFIVAVPEMKFSGELKNLLQEWKFTEVQSDGEPGEEYEPDDDGGSAEAGASLDGQSLNERKRLQDAEAACQAFQEYTESVYTRLAQNIPVPYLEIAEKIKGLCELLKEERRYLLWALQKTGSPEGQNYLAIHSVKSTIMSLLIGGQLKLPAHRLIELGAAALVHEAGMSLIPPAIYLKGQELSEEERKLIFIHPIKSYEILKNSGFPPEVCRAVLEHHERENGAGYPKKLTGDKISQYAKIIAAACSFEAQTGSRSYKEAKDGHTGMLDLLKNSGKQYDEAIIRALVFSLSIYPIGQYVLLSNGKKGQVVDTNPENPRLPIVRIFGEMLPGGRMKTVKTSPDGISISRPLSQEEIDSVP
ncbi:MAG: HD-GYP domain-containing protein [Treponema sp.]|jgi:HD-GYP domain-containing protein (c-di-GMP phosphodiesterase class II)|nr:HD-GYP domain-containing protein [Treponema sp.]